MVWRGGDGDVRKGILSVVHDVLLVDNKNWQQVISQCLPFP